MKWMIITKFKVQISMEVKIDKEQIHDLLQFL